MVRSFASVDYSPVLLATLDADMSSFVAGTEFFQADNGKGLGASHQSEFQTLDP